MPSASDGRPGTAALLGSTGATGKELLPLLLADPAYAKVITLTRRPSGITHPKLENRVVDFENLAEGLKGIRVDDGYCTFGTTIRVAGSEAAMTRIDHDYVIAFAKACLAGGATRFAYLSAANANAQSPVFYSRLKGRTEEELETLGFSELGLYRPAMIVAERADRRWVESMLFPLLPLIDLLLVGGLSKYRSIPVETLAKAIARFSTQKATGCSTRYWPEMVQA